MLRRRENFTPNILTVGNISLNIQSYELSGNGQSFVLPKLEYQMMELFMLNKGIYLSTEDLLVKVWGYDTDAEIGVVWYMYPIFVNAFPVGTANTVTKTESEKEGGF